MPRAGCFDTVTSTSTTGRSKSRTPLKRDTSCVARLLVRLRRPQRSTPFQTSSQLYPERFSQEFRLVAAMFDVGVAASCVDVGVAHPLLHLHDRGAVDRE